MALRAICFLLFGEHVDLVLAVVVQVGGVNNSTAEQTRKRLPVPQSGTAALAIKPDLSVGRIGDNDILPLVAI